MKITALSDLHGFLPELNETDLVIIAGDFSPLDIQQNKKSMKQWIETTFIDWLKSLKAKKIIFIAGNHDFVCTPEIMVLPTLNFEFDFYFDFFKPLLSEHCLSDKVSYLCNNQIEFEGLKIYGCPNVVGLTGWAFGDSERTGVYKKITECDILVTHQPPKIGGLGKVKLNNLIKEFGSMNLLNAIKSVKPKFVFCGHIHGGNHEKVILKHNDGQETILYNVSIKDEDYKPTFQPLEIEVL